MKWEEAYANCARFDESDMARTEEYTILINEIHQQREYVKKMLPPELTEAVDALLDAVYREAEWENQYYFAKGYESAAR